MEIQKSTRKLSLLTFFTLSGYTLLVIWVNQQFILKLPEKYPVILANISVNESINDLKSSTTAPQHVELYEIMAKQYDVPNGTYEGVPYKKILYWNHGVTLSSLYYGVGVGRDAFKKAGCPVWQCETSLKKSNLSQYDALVFRHNTWDGSAVPLERWPHQRYIFMEWESANWPTNGTSFYKYGFFNWTMTTRWDSDIVHPYGWIEPLNASSVPLHPSPEQIRRLMDENNSTNNSSGMKNRARMAAWFSSRCNLTHVTSGRERVVKSLIEYGVSVDIYGACGNLTCGNRFDNKTDEQDEICRQMASKNYKFYLAFENSLCLDYVTEKFYAMIHYPIIPVVMDLHNNYARAAPPHSFINVMDYPSIKDLADYLLILSKNETLYNEYFWWKPHFKIRNRLIIDGIHYRTFCSLCAALHDPIKHANKQTVFHENLLDWWKVKSDCKAVKIYERFFEEGTGQPYFHE